MNYGALFGGLRSRSLPSRAPLSWSYWEHVRLPAGGAYIEVAAPGPLLSMQMSPSFSPVQVWCSPYNPMPRPGSPEGTEASPTSTLLRTLLSTWLISLHLFNKPETSLSSENLKNTCVQGLFSIYCLPISGSWRYRGEKDSLCLPGTRSPRGDTHTGCHNSEGKRPVRSLFPSPPRLSGNGLTAQHPGTAISQLWSHATQPPMRLQGGTQLWGEALWGQSPQSLPSWILTLHSPACVAKTLACLLLSSLESEFKLFLKSPPFFRVQLETDGTDHRVVSLSQEWAQGSSSKALPLKPPSRSGMSPWQWWVFLWLPK